MKSSCGSESGSLSIKLWLPDNSVTDTGSLCSLLSAPCPVPSTCPPCLFWWINTSDTQKTQPGACSVQNCMYGLLLFSRWRKEREKQAGSHIHTQLLPQQFSYHSLWGPIWSNTPSLSQLQHHDLHAKLLTPSLTTTFEITQYDQSLISLPCFTILNHRQM